MKQRNLSLLSKDQMKNSIHDGFNYSILSNLRFCVSKKENSFDQSQAAVQKRIDRQNQSLNKNQPFHLNNERSLSSDSLARMKRNLCNIMSQKPGAKSKKNYWFNTEEDSKKDQEMDRQKFQNEQSKILNHNNQAENYFTDNDQSSDHKQKGAFKLNYQQNISLSTDLSAQNIRNNQLSSHSHAIRSWDQQKLLDIRSHKYFCSYLMKSVQSKSMQSILDCRYTERLYTQISLAKNQSQKDQIQNQEDSRLNKGLIIFGLEQTLISLDEDFSNEDNHKILTFKSPRNERKNYTVKFRPKAKELIDSLSNHFSLGIFTGFNKEAADKILKVIDPMKKIKIRYYKESCGINSFGIVKDMRLLKRSLKNVVFVDALLSSVVTNINNYVPIIPYRGQSNDDQLESLTKFLLEHILPSKNILKTISDHFQLLQWQSFRSGVEAVKALYGLKDGYE